EVRRVLRKDGVVWLNLGDSYASGKPKPNGYEGGLGWNNEQSSVPPPGLKPKDLCGIPWRVAFALQADGWWLRSDIIWHKPNPVPESVRDRPTRAHEYLFLLSKAARYYYNADAIKEPVTGNTHPRGDGVNPKAARWPAGTPRGRYRPKQNTSFSGAISGPVTERNKRTVWTIPTQPYAEAHFAAYPTKLVEPCILAGSREGDTVFDPFAGSGTTIKVARELNRRGVGLDLAYHDLALRRIANLQPMLREMK
ncbi:MAG: DNA-methyltransferase, partial [Acidobacteriota bacterium]